MHVIIRQYAERDVAAMCEIWNEVVRDGVAFPQTECLDAVSGRAFFDSQTCCGVAADSDSGRLLGLYILHPNNVGRCGHICSLEQGKAHGFRILQFNAVVRTNTAARRLYEKLGFVQLGVIPQGFLMKDGHYEDICPYYHTL